MSDRVTVYKGNDKAWYWHRQAGDGQVVSTGGEGSMDLLEATKAARRANLDVPAENFKLSDDA